MSANRIFGKPWCLVRRRSSDGFTLIELLVVLALVALCLTVATPNMRPAQDMAELRGAVARISGILRMARAEAISRNAERTVEVDVVRRRVSSVAVPEGITFGKNVVLAVTTLSRETRSPERASFRFFGDGSSTGGSIEMRMGANGARIDLDWLTGHARLVAGDVGHVAR